MTDLNAIWESYAAQIPGLLDRRPDFRFDPDYYGAATGQSHLSPDQLAEHYRVTGASAGVFPTRYAEMASTHPKIDQVLRQIVTDPTLEKILQAEESEANLLACELIGAGDAIDSQLSEFSAKNYLFLYPDVCESGINPLQHYLCYGAVEGRLNLGYFRKSFLKGHQLYNKELPTCMICIHEMSRTGAPLVGLEMAQQAIKTHNVIISSLRDGQLLEEFLKFSCDVILTQDPYRDFSIHPDLDISNIDYAIVNSVVSWNFVPLLVAHDIPFAGYIHEYAEYTRPSYPPALIALMSDLLVFSSVHIRDSWLGRLQDIKFDVERDSVIVPQRALTIGQTKPEDQEHARMHLSQIIGRNLVNSKIICGAGMPQWRKGTDIFATTSQICRNYSEEIVFIWIGHGIVRDELNFGAYMGYHIDQIGMNTKKKNLYFIEAGPAYGHVLAASDAMFLSSRLDPLPNVVFDALEYGCKIIQFSGATGFTDPVYQSSGMFVNVEYGNPQAAAEAAIAINRKISGYGSSFRPDYPLFDILVQRLKDQLKAQRYYVIGASDIDESIIYTSSDGNLALARVRERQKILTYGRRRVWRDLSDVKTEISASDNWVHKKLGISKYVTKPPGNVPDFSLHIHAYYLDDLAKDLASYKMPQLAKRIIVTTDTQKKGDKIRSAMAPLGLKPEIVLVPNTGRDILPFMHLFKNDGIDFDDEYWCHIHQKKSFSSGTGGDKWRQFLMRILFGEKNNISNCLEHLLKSDVGFVAPFDPHFLGWDESRSFLNKFSSILPHPLPEHPLLFPVGNMFWVRRSVVLAMNDFFGPDYPWPSEPIANDGTEYHLIERLWPAMAASLGLESVFVHKLDEKRV
jgi:hypothetical protein